MSLKFDKLLGKIREKDNDFTPAKVFNVMDYGAVGDGKNVTDGSINIVTNNKILTSASGLFTASDVGKSIRIIGAGAAGVLLTTTIASYQSATQVTLTASAGTTVSGKSVDWGTDDTTAINNALTDAAVTGGIVQGVKGKSYLISDPLVIGSNTIIDMRLCTVILANGSVCNMLIDSAHNLGTLTVPSPMSEIHVIGGIWDMGDQTGGGGNTSHAIILGGNKVSVEHLTLKSTVCGYGILLQNVTNFFVDDIEYDDYNRDGVHIQGPASNGKISNIRGTTADDLVVLTPLDWSSYNWGNEGDITDIVIENIFPTLCGTNAVKVIAGKKDATVLNTKHIRIKNVMGSMATGCVSGIFLGDDPQQPETKNGQLDDVEIDGVSLALPNQNIPIIGIVAASTSLQINQIKIRNISIISDCVALVYTHAKINSLIIDGILGGTLSNAMVGLIYMDSQYDYPYINRLYLNNLDVSNNGSQNGNIIATLNASQGLAEVFMNNVFVYNFYRLAELYTSTIFYLNKVHISTNGNLFRLPGTNALTIQGCNACVFDNSGEDISGTSTIESKDYGFPIDVSNTRLVKNTGNMAYNTNDALSCGVGAVGWNGREWLNINSGKVYGVGGLTKTAVEVASASLSGATGVIAVNIPVGAKILGVQLRVDTLITSGDGGTTWSAVYSGGAAAQAIGSGLAFTKNTKLNKMFDPNANTPLVTSSVGTITVAPNSGTFSVGIVRAIVYYEDFTAMGNAA